MQNHLLEQATKLSLRARAALALHAFAGYCKHFHLDHPEVTRFTDYFWHYLPVNDTEMLRQWGATTPALSQFDPGQDYPEGFTEHLISLGIDAKVFCELLADTYDMIDGSLYAATDNAGTLKNLANILNIVGKHDINLPDISRFQSSLWEHNGGWGFPLSQEELKRWRAS